MYFKLKNHSKFLVLCGFFLKFRMSFGQIHILYAIRLPVCKREKVYAPESNITAYKDFLLGSILLDGKGCVQKCVFY